MVEVHLVERRIRRLLRVLPYQHGEENSHFYYLYPINFVFERYSSKIGYKILITSYLEWLFHALCFLSLYQVISVVTNRKRFEKDKWREIRRNFIEWDYIRQEHLIDMIYISD